MQKKGKRGKFVSVIKNEISSLKKVQIEVKLSVLLL